VDDIRVQRPKSQNIDSHFVVPKAKIRLADVASVFEPAMTFQSNTAAAAMPLTQPEPAPESPQLSKTRYQSKKNFRKEKLADLFHDYTFAACTLLFLAMALVISPVYQGYMSSDFSLESLNQNQPKNSMAGLNISVSAGDLASKVQAITDQSASLNLGNQTVAISPTTIKSWLQITPNISNTKDNIHISSTVIDTSLLALANSYVHSPVNQVTITRSDGSSEVAIAGQNGTQFSNSSSLAVQAVQISKNLMGGSGFRVNTPLISAPFQAWTPANFSKLIVTDLNSKRMYVYQSGQLIRTFLVSAGKPSTPTPVGEFHIWDKLTSQTMTGPGYVQPNVPWVNYFDHSGDAIHGVYWRPASVFGNINTSHGCVGVPVDIGEWIYNWAPIGTTVITTPN
jgi:lipoprotein-anchoring transpeptidase ErfK/SrfK